MGLKEITIH